MTECNISAEEVHSAVKKQLASDSFKIVDFTIKKASDEILGFMGEHVRITVNVIHQGEDKELKYFGKKMPMQPSHKNYAEGTKAFYKEIEMYKTLFDDMQQAISTDRRHLKWRPNCYYTRDWDLVVVEDLSLLGFYMLPERTLMPLEYLRAALAVMARMHAGSIIFEEKLNDGKCSTKSTYKTTASKPYLIKDLYPNLIFESECTDKPGHCGFAFWEAGIRGQETIIGHLPNYSKDQKEKIRKTFGNTVRQVYRMLEPSKEFRNVMIHADLWGNNLLFRNGKDGKVAEAITVDFQMTRYAPPAQDVYMLLHIMQDKPFRDSHEAELVEFYYKTLTQELADENLDIEKLLPRKEFDDSCKFFKRYAILNQMIYTQLNITPSQLSTAYFKTPEEYDKVMLEDRSDILVESYLTDDLCRARVTESMDEIIQEFALA